MTRSVPNQIARKHLHAANKLNQSPLHQTHHHFTTIHSSCTTPIGPPTTKLATQQYLDDILNQISRNGDRNSRAPSCSSLNQTPTSKDQPHRPKSTTVYNLLDWVNYNPAKVPGWVIIITSNWPYLRCLN